MSKSITEVSGLPDTTLPEFSLFDSCTNTANPRENLTLITFINDIRRGRWKKEVEACREVFLKRGKDAYSSRRVATVPAVTLSAMIRERRKGTSLDQKNAIHSQNLQLDFDGKDHPGIAVSEIRRIVEAAPFVTATFLSLSGDGVKAIARCPASFETHAGSWRAAKAYFDKHGLRLDDRVKSALHLCFVSYDPDASYNPDAIELVPLVVPKSVLMECENVEATEDNETIWERLSMKNKLVPKLLRGEWGGGQFQSQSEADFSLACSICEETGNHSQQEEIFFESGLYRNDRKMRVTFPNARLRVAEQLAEKQAMLSESDECQVDLTQFDCNDYGNAERVHAYAGSNFHHIIQSGSWIVWDGSRWVSDANGGMTRLFVSVMKLTGKQAHEISDHVRAEVIVKHAFKSRNAAKVQAGIQMLKSILGVSVSVNELDADPCLIGTAEGVIDLREGKPTTPYRSSLITKCIGTRYDGSATCPTWEKFLHTVTAGDSEMIRYLQLAVGYTLTGSNAEQCLFFLHGSGQNGKGVYSETLKRLFGDYGQVAPESMFVKDRNQSATNDIARLAGCRLAVASELGEGTAFAESRLKSLTGNDTITARFLHKEFFDFAPTHHYWISGNHKPTIQGSDHGIWRRIRLIPFTVRISDAEKDPNLIEKLAEEMPGILNWALAGSLRWQDEGLKTPRCVTRATDDYRCEEDMIGQFLEECTSAEPSGRVIIRELYEAFHRWSLKGGTKSPIRAKDFGKRLDERGIERLASNGGRYWIGLSLGGLDELV